MEGTNQDGRRPSSGVTAADGDEPDLAACVTRLGCDNEDLRFDCVRLQQSNAQKQAEIFALSESNASLRREYARLRQELDTKRSLPAMISGQLRPLKRAVLRKIISLLRASRRAFR